MATTPWQPSAEMKYFLQRLGTTPHRWCLNKIGYIRGNTIEDPYEDCPLAAVARQDGHMDDSIIDWDRAAVVVGLSLLEAESVVCTADNRLDHMHNTRLRALLLAATVNRPAVPQPSIPPAPDPMDQALADLVAEGVPAEPAGQELTAV